MKWIFGAILACTCMLAIDATVLPVSLPTIQREMSISFMEQQWIVNAYNLSLAAFVIAGARMGDRLGHRITFIIGLTVFTIASALCGLSETGWWFIVNRFIQGIGGALLTPSMNTILYHSFPREQRSRIVAANLSISSLCLLIAPCLGGALTQYLSWRYIFWMNLPIAFFALYCTRFLPVLPYRQLPFQIWEFLTFAFGCLGLIIGLMEGRTWGWNSITTLGLLSLSFVSFICFFLHMKKQESPFLQLSFLKNQQLRAALGSVFILTMIQCVILFWTLYLQNILHRSPLMTGIIAAFVVLPVVILSFPTLVWAKRITLKIPVALGFFLIGIQSIWFCLNPTPSQVSTLYYMAILFGIALSLILVPCAVVSMNELSEEDQSKVSSVTSTMRQFATALGLAAMAVLFVIVREEKFDAHLKQEKISLDSSTYHNLLENTKPAKDALSQLPDSTAKLVIQDYTLAYTDGFMSVNVFTALLSLIGAIFAILSFKKTVYSVLK